MSDLFAHRGLLSFLWVRAFRTKQKRRGPATENRGPDSSFYQKSLKSASYVPASFVNHHQTYRFLI